MSIQEQIKSLAASYSSDIVETRRHLHAHPELSFQEHETMRFVADKLKSFGLEPQEKVADTGIIVKIEGNNPQSRTIALRADIDALPILEQNDVPYKSKNEGVMHACGHDVHTSSLLGTARILNEIKDKFEGTIQLVFQPGEEKIPGGASLMIKEGILNAQDGHEAPSSMIGQHVMPLLDVGQIGFREGKYMASADEIYVRVKGKGGHGAMPELCIDPILITSHIIVALQQIVSRHASPKMPSVLTFGTVMAKGATNIIPNEVYLEGTFRTFNEEWRMTAHEKMKKMATGIAEAMGGSCDFDIKVGYPFLNNNPELTRRMRYFAEAYVGPKQVVDLDLWMAAEDFAYYSQEVDACFYRLGTRNEDRGITSSVHTPTFDVDEAALEIGAGLMSWLAMHELNSLR